MVIKKGPVATYFAAPLVVKKREDCNSSAGTLLKKFIGDSNLIALLRIFIALFLRFYCVGVLVTSEP